MKKVKLFEAFVSEGKEQEEAYNIMQDLLGEFDPWELSDMLPEDAEDTVAAYGHKGAKAKRIADYLLSMAQNGEFESVVTESDINDPVLIAFRAAKMKREKELAKPKRKPLYGKQRQKAEDQLWDISQYLKDLYADRGQLLIDMEEEAEAEGGPIADEYGDKLNKIEDEIQRLISNRNKLEVRLAESVVNEDVTATKSLANEMSGELYNATLNGDSVTIKATTTNKTWEDGVPVLKYLARGKASSTKIKMNGPFEIAHDVARGWFYFTDGNTWYGLHGDDYPEVDDLPFTVSVAESMVNEAKTLNRDEMMEWLEDHLDFVRTTEEFSGSPGGIWISGENGDEYKGKVIYAYYSEDYKNRTFGVLNKWEKELNKRGWYSEWNDPGTVMIWPN
jgi:hypothetical protein